jgi:hypothetical protein
MYIVPGIAIEMKPGWKFIGNTSYNLCSHFVQDSNLPNIRDFHYYYYYYFIELQMGFYSVAVVLQ